MTSRAGKKPEEHGARVVMGVYSHEHDKAFGAVFWTSQDMTLRPDLPPWQLHEINALFHPVVDGRAILRADVRDPKQFDPATADLMPLIEAQRRPRVWREGQPARAGAAGKPPLGPVCCARGLGVDPVPRLPIRGGRARTSLPRRRLAGGAPRQYRRAA